MKIISGGQTGADRAGLDAAMALGMDYGGAIPKGRLAEDGPLAAKYGRMTELNTPFYPDRTRMNVEKSDATIVFSRGTPGGGSALTIEFACRYEKPWLHVDLSRLNEDEAVRAIQNWLMEIGPSILNVAGSKESTSPGIYRKVYRILIKVFRNLMNNPG